MNDADLMAAIRKRYGELIAEVCKASQVLPEFLAALVANESGGDPHAQRFEKDVLVHLWEVLAGRKAAFGSITRADLFDFIAPAGPEGTTLLGPVGAGIHQALGRLDVLATSWGLTQVMGYNASADGSFRSIHKDPSALADPRANLVEALRCLARFAEHFQLDAHNEHEALLRCWNSGQPDGKAFDPHYVANGLARMELYRQLPALR